MIKHIWFDLDGTLTVHTPEFNEAHNELRYQTYSDVVKKPVTDELKSEFEALYKIHGSNSKVFRSLGLPSDFWQQHFNTLDESQFFKPSEIVTSTLSKLKGAVPISIFTNVTLDRVQKTLKAIDVDQNWFTYILSGDDIEERKPALDGFRLVIEKSKLLPEEIVYVGDRLDVDIFPAKEVGMKTVLVWSKSDKADYSFENFGEMVTILDS